MPIAANKALVGYNAFSHEAGIHTHGILAHTLTYEPLQPHIVGRERQMILGKHTGQGGARREAEGAGAHRDRPAAPRPTPACEDRDRVAIQDGPQALPARVPAPLRAAGPLGRRFLDDGRCGRDPTGERMSESNGHGHDDGREDPRPRRRRGPHRPGADRRRERRPRDDARAGRPIRPPVPPDGRGDGLGSGPRGDRHRPLGARLHGRGCRSSTASSASSRPRPTCRTSTMSGTTASATRSSPRTAGSSRATSRSGRIRTPTCSGRWAPSPRGSARRRWPPCSRSGGSG